MFLQFTDVYGYPVHVRPERVDAVKGINLMFEGTPRPCSLIVTTNRETFRIRGSADETVQAIFNWHEAQKASTPEYEVPKSTSAAGVIW